MQAPFDIAADLHTPVSAFLRLAGLGPRHLLESVEQGGQGRYSFIGASTVITKDVPPFSKVVAERETHCLGVNAIGLERRGFSAERIEAIEQAFRLLLRSKMNTTQAVEQMRASLNGSVDVEELVRFIETAERGVIK